MARRSIWERLHESTEGPTVTISLPREWAEELLRSLMTSLEMEDGEGGMEDPDMDMGDDDADADVDGLPGMDDDFLGDDEPGGFSAGDEGDDVPDFAAGDDDDEDDAPTTPKKKAPAKKDDKSKSKEKDDDDEKDEGTEYGQTRPQTALGESTFARLAGKLSVRRPTRGRRR